MKHVTVYTLLFLSLLAIFTVSQTNMVVVAQEQPSFTDSRQMTFFDQIESQLALYNKTGNWALKVHPSDQLQLPFAESPIYIEVYVSDIESINQSSIDVQTDEVVHVIQVCSPTEQAISKLSEIPNSYFYVSRYSPSICMTVEKQALEQIAKIPSVYCIRVLPNHATGLNDSSSETLSLDLLWLIPLLAVIAIAATIIVLKIKKRKPHN